jgi:hypothetical protein
MAVNYKSILNEAKAGNWAKAHIMVQDYSDSFSCMIHGYLHRVEGDLGNARYWYSRANEPMLSNSLEEELERLFDQIP